MTPSFSVLDKQVLREFKLSEDPLEIFDGYALHRGHPARVSRIWRGSAPGKIGRFTESLIYVDGRPADYGEDPRPFTHGGNLNVASVVFTRGFGFRYHLVEFDHNMNWTRSIMLPPSGVSIGKNWTPFSLPNGKLAFIHSFSPMKLLVETRREVGVILFELVEGPGIPSEEGDHGFPAHRGGSNGITLGRFVFGLGHTTRRARNAQGELIVDPGCLFPHDQQLIHRPFAWQLDLSTLELREIPLTDTNWDERFFIIDSTSLIRDDQTGHFDLFTAEVNRNFTQPDDIGQACRYRLELRNAEV